ncbi:hypothetical protein AMEX_G20112 [Astyanax mexicanus]|uniref:Uncharacterized protein n=1 Tax=Astyanax mexicanus TaxID=7994 RepID=A0A8T2L8J4_ASTMX|nr:hypothetical protein AMEX_G20112 [Astyanax mexicanus]
MVEITNQQGAVLAFVSLATLGLVSAICLGCRKKSMTRPNQITSDQSPSFGNTGHASHIQPQAVQDTHSSYQNLPNSICGSLEPAYINPIPTPPSKDLPDELMDIDAGAYENVFPAKYIDHDSDSYDYENAQYLQNNDDDEPDYENTNPLVHHENMS